MAETYTTRVQITNIRGFHARASARFVKMAESFESEIVVYKSSDQGPGEPTKVSGKSILGLMMLAAEPGSTVEIEATGPDAEQAVESLLALVRNKFDEE